ncbi:hypothetical protein WN51_00363 [Melipona quadrifasciata]|uniref:Uncharacterized protein n=1 Tax=Melipona quadrifasciata TaxID=166423 RepID=A0A0N1ITH2_9HYME|nr:hypothetical protein WN51_00363 [Melipona quadrifasciata]
MHLFDLRVQTTTWLDPIECLKTDFIKRKKVPINVLVRVTYDHIARLPSEVLHTRRLTKIRMPILPQVSLFLRILTERTGNVFNIVRYSEHRLSYMLE